MTIDQRTPQDILESIQEIASLVMFAAEADTLEQVLQRIAVAARELVNARYAALGVPDGQGGLRFFKVAGISAHQISLIPHPPVGLGLIGAIMNEREVIRLPRMLDDPRAVGFPEGHPEMTSLLGVPIQVGHQLFGMLYLTDREDGEHFSDTDQWLVETMAGYAALAIAGSQLRDQQRRLTTLEERQRIGMELHDGVIQSLYAIGMHLDLMRRTTRSQPADFEVAIEGLNTVIEDIRSYIMNLKSRPYGAKTIRQELQEIVNRLYIPEGMQVHVEAPDYPPPFDQKDFESLCFIMREALSNATRHSQATYLSVRCWQEADVFHIMVRDNGRGFDLMKAEEQQGLGLHNIRERIRQHGGEFRLETSPNSGTHLNLTVPTRP
ncbi:MAG: hypothetical protein OHK0046_14980 [Anaerolineae bacterium]